MSKFGFIIRMSGFSYGGWGDYGIRHDTVYDTREAAEAVCPKERSYLDKRFDYHPTFKVVERTWVEAAQSKFDNLVWQRPVWETNGSFHPIHNHFAHPAESDSRLVAFIEDEAKGQADRWTMMKPGRYLRRFYPDLGTQEVEYWASWFEKGQQPEIELDIEMKIAMTAEEMIDVYERGPDSCMKGMQAVKGYAGGDLGIAYYEYNGRIVARCLCWPEGKAFGAIYIRSSGFPMGMRDSEFQDYMEAKFQKMGWTSAYSNDKVFNGARLAIHPVRGNSGMIHMPYFDHFGAVWDEDRQCLIAHSYDRNLTNLGCGGTGGQMAFNMTKCAIFRKMVPSTQIVEVALNLAGTKRRAMCLKAAETRAWQCAGTGTWYSNRLKPAIIEDRKYSRAFVKTNMKTCMVSGKKALRGSMRRFGSGPTERYVLREYQSDPRYFFYAPYDGSYYPLDEESKTYPGWHRMYDNDGFSDATRRDYGRKVEVAIAA